MNQLMRMVFGTAVRSAVYRFMRSLPPVAMFGIAIIAAVGYVYTNSLR